ncbi:MAG TPA: S-methyl-5-thioribose-1-phosphate isomerase, partial [Anaerolineaceae bacterium]|nr:S-methyl-5-thioribose-1-phosphate isomerase [Anaerolineaceae bacterium]
RMIDQRKLPAALEFVYCSSVREMADAIRNMTIRGAPALGVAGAFGLALEAIRPTGGDILRQLFLASELLKAARPTAVNLAWGVERILKLTNQHEGSTADLAERILAEALEMAEEDVRTNLALAQHGASLIDDGETILHHCNTGALAVVDWGTALGAIRYAHQQGKHIHVLVDETRPRLQGSRLTAWELEQYSISYHIITDNAAGYYLRSGKVQKVFFGADRVAANGDVVNKIGTYMLSLAANANRVPVICVFPLSTLDLTESNGDNILIEERLQEEVLGITYQGQAVTPAAAQALNPAFDITPHELISAWVTERGIIYPPFDRNLAQVGYNTRLDR